MCRRPRRSRCRREQLPRAQGKPLPSGARPTRSRQHHGHQRGQRRSDWRQRPDGPCPPGGGHQRGREQARITPQAPTRMTVTVTASTATTATLQASSEGATGNSTAVSTNWAGALFAGGDLAGGVDGQLATGSLTVNQPLPTAGETVTIGGTTYTFVTNITAATGNTAGSPRHRTNWTRRPHDPGQLGGRHQRLLNRRASGRGDLRPAPSPTPR